MVKIEGFKLIPIKGWQSMMYAYNPSEEGFYTFLTTNGLGGYCSVCHDGSVKRCDQGYLVSAERAPDYRVTLVHRLREQLILNGRSHFLSSQDFADGQPSEEGCCSRFTYDTHGTWEGSVGKLRFRKACAMVREENTTALLYELCNDEDQPCTLLVEPMLKMAPKEEALQAPCSFHPEGCRIVGEGLSFEIRTNGNLQETAPRWEWLSYPEDHKDGRPCKGLAGSCCQISLEIPAHSRQSLEILFSTTPCHLSAREVLLEQDRYLRDLAEASGFQDPVAGRLAMAADAYISRRDSTGGKTILAGYPLFSDWGRDTMIALRGCCLASGRLQDAGSILKTFLSYERRGLVPNLFPEGGREPMYNTADAALLLIDSVYRYYLRTGDLSFVREAFPVMNRILEAYCMGTDHAIRLQNDGLIQAGQGYDQVTWMDVRIGDILPTPRHGKPVEINAFWYNALKVMETLGKLLGKNTEAYEKLADLTKTSFLREFCRKDGLGLKDVVSGTDADLQIRCNQIFAVSMPFTMLDHSRQKAVVDTVFQHLFTDRGLRSLSPEDPQYHPSYGGSQLRRDLAYHQGTVWVFPLGSFYLAYLRVQPDKKAAAAQVRRWLSSMEDMLREGCAGQLPEIYDGDQPRQGKGCFAQAWSVGEMLLVYEALEKIQRGESFL